MRRLASLQRGHVARDQLLAAGISRGMILRWLKTGWLVAVHRGVYRLGHDAEVPLGREMAALLLTHGQGVLSHHSAVAVWGLWDAGDWEVHVTITGRDMRSRPGLRITHAGELHPDDWEVREGLAVTSPARTVIDLGGYGRVTAERALNELRVQRRLIERRLHEALDRARTRAGVANVRAILAAEADSGFTRSEAERRLRQLVRDAQLPMPRFNRRVLGLEVDAVWERERVVVEVDGYGAHGTRGAFERDRLRDQRLAAAGHLVIRVTWWQLTREPIAVASRIAQALALTTARAGLAPWPAA